MPRSRADWDEELAAGMLEDLEEITGISIGEMMADALEIPENIPEGFETYGVYEEPRDDEPLDIDQDYGNDVGDYFDELFDDLDVDPDSEDSYGDDNG